MPPVRRTYQSEAELLDLILEAVQRLSQGELVGIPTPLGYVAVRKGTENETLSFASAGQNVPPRSGHESCRWVTWAWAVRGSDELSDFFSPVPAVSERLLGRFSPGSLVVLNPADVYRYQVGKELESFLQQKLLELPGVEESSAVGCVVLSGQVGELLQSLSPWPLMVGFLHQPEGDLRKYPREEPASLENLFQNWLNYTIEAEVLAGVSAPAVVKVQGRGIEIIEPGQLTDELIMERSGPSLLFVCTGNTCRSPMAEVICRKLLSERLGCDPEELSARGIEITSAGLAADYGDPASPEAVMLLAEEGIELAGHQSQPISLGLLERSDLILTMTAHHRQMILSHRPDLGTRVRTLGGERKDIPDPFGSGLEVYRQCKQSIEAALVPIVEQIVREL